MHITRKQTLTSKCLNIVLSSIFVSLCFVVKNLHNTCITDLFYILFFDSSLQFSLYHVNVLFNCFKSILTIYYKCSFHGLDSPMYIFCKQFCLIMLHLLFIVFVITFNVIFLLPWPLLFTIIILIIKK